MGRPKKNVNEFNALADVVGSSDTEINKTEIKNDDVIIAVALRHGHKFSDIPDGNGGVKEIYLVGLDDELRGKREGILSPDGRAKYQRLSRTDWENILKIHGKEQMFKPFNGFPPCVFEIEGGMAEAHNYESEIKNIKTGLAPVDLKKSKVEEN